MTTLDKYLLREIAVPFAVGLALFLVVLAFSQILKVSDAVTGLGIDAAELGWALVYSFPPLLGLLIPVSGLFSTLLGVGRLAADREIIGLCAAGLSPYALLRVPAVLGLLLAIVSGLVMGVGESWGIRGLRHLMARSAQRALASGVEVGEFYEWLPGVTFYAQDREGGELIDVLFADLRESDTPIVVSAKRGVMQRGDDPTDLVFELRDGRILMGDQRSSAHRLVQFETSRYRLDVTDLVGNKAKTLSPIQEKSISQLWRDSKISTDLDDRNLMIITLNRKFAIPLATLIFSVLAVPLACRSNPGARARGFLFSSAIVGAYYYVGRAAELSARSGGMQPVLAAWLPNLLGVAGLLLLLWRFRRSAT